MRFTPGDSVPVQACWAWTEQLSNTCQLDLAFTLLVRCEYIVPACYLPTGGVTDLANQAKAHDAAGAAN